MQTHRVLEDLGADGRSRVLATLAKHFGDLDFAEEMLQEALVQALRIWPERGMPRVPEAWLTTAAKRKGVDAIRRDQAMVLVLGFQDRVSAGEEQTQARLARVYDPLDPDRSDLDAYIELVKDENADQVLDVGCGTGTLAVMLARSGIQVVGFDPAAASVDVARTKTDSNLVEWVIGTAEDVAREPSYLRRFDVATMTANVAQVFLEDADWHATLRSIRQCLKPGGLLAFETRNPEVRAWKNWTKENTWQRVEIEGEGAVEEWKVVTKVDGELVSFESPTIFHSDGQRLVSYSTLRFRTEVVLRQNLEEAGFTTVEFQPLPFAPERSWLITARA
ncbi:methyltransferase domain-containing protein [Nesterenkonia sp. MY13]|uniref:Methyltransferase domain-containing protein n=1 Tax=Nesterenkonia sedimenti TaxID=1463632 RepID=A0A7X8YCJ3_9MICC|nr:class I SAM-dependent methyltransferase [Nesterenkonia sedimenti]NLS08500.1 methyltransferase domain-containing protein [Nesterenkonia sedimenti]